MPKALLHPNVFHILKDALSRLLICLDVLIPLHVRELVWRRLSSHFGGQVHRSLSVLRRAIEVLPHDGVVSSDAHQRRYVRGFQVESLFAIFDAFVAIFLLTVKFAGSAYTSGKAFD